MIGLHPKVTKWNRRTIFQNNFLGIPNSMCNGCGVLCHPQLPKVMNPMIHHYSHTLVTSNTCSCHNNLYHIGIGILWLVIIVITCYNPILVKKCCDSHVGLGSLYKKKYPGALLKVLGWPGAPFGTWPIWPARASWVRFLASWAGLDNS